jgi:TolB-like protein
MVIRSRSVDPAAAIAVLPFRNLGGNPEEEYFGEGITEDIISGLARSHALYVIARNSTLRYRDRQTDARAIASELGVRYILEGSVRRQASRLRISSELIDAANNRTVWAEVRRRRQRIFAFRTASRPASSVRSSPRSIRSRPPAFAKPTDSLDAYECVPRAVAPVHVQRCRLCGGAPVSRARGGLDPLRAGARIPGLVVQPGDRGGRSARSSERRREGRTGLGNAVELDPDDAFCLAVSGASRHTSARISRMRSTCSIEPD